MNNKKVYIYTKRIFIIIFTFWFVIFFIPHSFRWCGETIIDYSFARQEYFRDYEMKENEAKKLLSYNVINLKVNNLKGMVDPPPFSGASFEYVSFEFQKKDIHFITNKLVNSWGNNRGYGMIWNTSSKWEIIKEPVKINVLNKNIINLTFPKGSLKYNCYVINHYIIINTNNMECIFVKRGH